MTQTEPRQPETRPPAEHTGESRFFMRRLRRRSLAERLLWLVWALLLLLLLDFAVTNQQEHEWQAATIAGALFLVILVGGIIANAVWRIEAEDQDKYH